MNQLLVNAHAEGRTILTPNQRAARAIRQAFEAGQTAPLWDAPQILPLESWLAALWQQRVLAGQETRVLLNRTQEASLWREIIAVDAETSGLRSPDALTALAVRAWNLACLHQARGRLRETAASTDTRAFDRWSRVFGQRLIELRSITAAELPGALGVVDELPQTRITLVDFDRQPPAVAALLGRLEVERVDTSLGASSQGLYAAPDDRKELEAAAHWIAEIRSADPAARIAVVVPNLADRRAAIERVFAPVLAPESLPVTAPQGPAEFEFSLGRPLAGLPATTAALDLLAWPMGPLPLERISALLLSPWFAGSREVAAFDAFELRKTRLLRPELTLERMIHLIEQSKRDGLEGLLGSLRGLGRAARAAHMEPLSARRPNPDRQSYAGWADAFRGLLEAAGWMAHAGGESQGRESLAFEQRRAFEGALDELATLDFDGRKPSAAEALAGLKRILAETVFAPKSQDARVQIMGPLELGGVGFDALWLLGADDLNWPPAAAANPLIAWQLQRALGMPGADGAGDEAAAERLTERLAKAAPKVVFSYAVRAEEGERRPSSLLARLNQANLSAPLREPTEARAVFERVRDETRLHPLPGATVRGGARVLKLQAACGFRAFAELRLWSAEPEPQVPGFDALERGNLVHAVMQHLWTELQTQAGLKALGVEATAEALYRAVTKAFSRTVSQPYDGGGWNEAYLRVQRRRMRDLLLPWLAIERERPAFVVEPTEQKKRVQVGPLALDLRIDRIDLTARGRLIVDYKTGSSTPAEWQGERPDEPQLPLYAVLAQAENNDLAGVAFALLRPGDGLGMKGFADDDAIFGRTARMEGATLAEQVERWNKVLTRLASAFAEGDARVLPKEYPKTCGRCGQRLLCRLNPAALDDGGDEAEEGEPADG